ncbi:MAG: hypothetical protein A2Z12_07495 [Actinobacteria bacterium RBG_16_68_21]|nr:MAG: hypothetical protein A2Z12_07495 [Actinobacteria bacterium RBG_16_68_21]
MSRLVAGIATVVIVVAGCSGGDQRVTGIVLGVDGDLTAVRSFQLLTTDGDRLEFVPGSGVHAFPDGTPLTHLSEHLQTGTPIRVTYRVEDGVNTAVIVEDAP